ncbi:hypothetical protein [Alteromonas stellipolaris]|uniref:Uncharacterized protein n=1 Tax=Alteromonas stellipolaris TaxID=233316 RepID=A0ABM5YQ28_9ALTE|nr:hypothetical protein AVL57_00845 [Alteromonas stellipolaris]
MNIETVKSFQQKGAVSQVTGIGLPNGDLVLVMMVNGMEVTLTHMNEFEKVFRSPKYILSYLKEHGFKECEFNLTNWGIDKIFDPHKQAVLLKKKALNRKDNHV